MKRINLFTIILLSFICSNAYAGTRLYKIELLIFAQDMPNTEVFDQIESQIDWPSKLSELSDYKQLNSQFMNLHGSYKKLLQSQDYQPIMHVAWIQSLSSNRLGRAVKISNPSGTINGFFRLQRGSLVHMIADIEYSADSVKYRLNEKRRFKLNDLHYLDHPKFGILARVSPI